jgi:transcriptional regulator
MYKISYFTETDKRKVFEFMQKYPFVIIAGAQNNFPVATHVPLEVKKQNEKVVLTGHIMKDCDHYRAFSQNENVLVIFTGPHCYVSASWYVTKNVASTWNYMDVYARGKIKFTDDAGTKKIIEKITNQYEELSSEAAFNKMPAEYVDRMLKAIIGFQIEVETLDNVFKLSQNHDEISKRQIIEKLKNTNDNFAKEIAREMEDKNKE